MNNEYLQPRDHADESELVMPDGGGPIIRDPLPATVSGIAICRREDCDGAFYAGVSSVSQLPVVVPCPQCKVGYAFAVVGGKMVYGMAL